MDKLEPVMNYESWHLCLSKWCSFNLASIWFREFQEATYRPRQTSHENEIILTDEWVATLEYKKYDDEIKTAHSGYMRSQGTVYVGNLKGVKHLYQHTFADTYSKAASQSFTWQKHQSRLLDMLKESSVTLLSTEATDVKNINRTRKRVLRTSWTAWLPALFSH